MAVICRVCCVLITLTVYLVSNHFITNFPQNVPVKFFLKIGQYLAKVCEEKFAAYFFWPTLYTYRYLISCYVKSYSILHCNCDRVDIQLHSAVSLKWQ